MLIRIIKTSSYGIPHTPYHTHRTTPFPLLSQTYLYIAHVNANPPNQSRIYVTLKL